jgi:hypothetical protein
MGKSVEQQLAELKALIEGAGEELPAKIDVPKICNFNDCDLYSNHEDCGGGCFEFNKALSQCLPILAKKNLRIAELEGKLKAITCPSALLDKDWKQCQVRKQIEEKDLRIRELEEKYNELIFEVGNKYRGETRHQTALKYIKRAEEVNGLEVEKMRIEEVPNEPRHKH